jgi:hypothetical protein
MNNGETIKGIRDQLKAIKEAITAIEFRLSQLESESQAPAVRFASETPTEKQVAERVSKRINEAYETLERDITDNAPRTVNVNREEPKVARGVCPSCFYHNDFRFRYCGQCGTALLFPCGKCGEHWPITYKFCGDCGSPM